MKRRAGRIVSGAILAVSVVLCIVVSSLILTRGYVSIFGYSMFRVVTGSMEPTIPVGAAVISQKTDIEKIEAGDIVCFQSREPDHYGVIVTHRVVDKTYDGGVLLETRGDANVVSDGHFVNESNLIGRVVWYSGKESVITNLLSFITGRTGFFICLVFPILFIAGLILQFAVKNMRKEIQNVEKEFLTEDKPLPGYETLTEKDYQEIYCALKEELKNGVEGSDQKTE